MKKSILIISCLLVIVKKGSNFHPVLQYHTLANNFIPNFYYVHTNCVDISIQNKYKW